MTKLYKLYAEETIPQVEGQFEFSEIIPQVGGQIGEGLDNVLAQYAVNSSNAPVGISEYELSDLMPENFKGALPSIEEIERELK